MRFSEFRVLLEKKILEDQEANEYYTVGDSHAVGLANYAGKPWINKGKNGTPSTAPMHVNAINNIPKGSVVLISVGANDTFGNNPDPQTIASNVSNLVSKAKSNGLKVTFLLFPIGTRPNAEIRRKTREAIKNSIDVPIVDLEGSRLVDGVHADASGYKNASAQVLSGLKPNLNKNISIGNTDSVPGAPRIKDRIINSSELQKGPPYPPELFNEIKKMQQSLQELGYNLGRTGIDGKYGPFTSAAVAAFKKDYGLQGSGSRFGDKEFSTLSQIAAGQITRVPASRPDTVTTAKEIPQLRTDAVTTGKVGKVLDFIAAYESRGNYNVILGGSEKPLTTMTIDQVFDLQSDMVNRGMESSAVGRYQYIEPTLKDMVKYLKLDPKITLFDEKTQDKIAVADLRRRCDLDGWLNGTTPDEKFLYKLSKVWASIPNPQTGSSFYDKVGSNKAGVKTNIALAALDNISSMA